MEKECCDIKFSETEKGYRIEITGEDIKTRCKPFFENCCSPDYLKKCFEKCCGIKE